MKPLSRRGQILIVVATSVIATLLLTRLITGGITSPKLSSSDASPSSNSAAISPSPSPTGTLTSTSPADPSPTTCPTTSAQVSTAKQLTDSLAAATPGTVISLAAGLYKGNFVATAVGTAAQPIWLCGGADAILDGGKTSSGYVVHLDGAEHWNLVGFSVQDGQKGVVTDHASFNTIDNLTVSGIGDEGIHLRAGSTDNTVRGNRISHTGLLVAKYGEGIYVGSAEKNWCSISNCQPDKSDNNILIANQISNTTAENIDIKEGTTGGQILENNFNGTGMVESAATAWVNVKGNQWVISGNSGTGSIGDGFQTHQILNGWGDSNTFKNNTAAVNGPGYGFHLTPSLNNVVECNNVVTGAAKGASSPNCTA